jgi:hypothetical protein
MSSVRTNQLAGRAYAEAHSFTVTSHEHRLESVDALALALRWACSNLGLTYSECIDRVSKAWGPGQPPSRSTTP